MRETKENYLKTFFNWVFFKHLGNLISWYATGPQRSARQLEICSERGRKATVLGCFYHFFAALCMPKCGPNIPSVIFGNRLFLQNRLKSLVQILAGLGWSCVRSLVQGRSVIRYQQVVTETARKGSSNLLMIWKR